MVGFNKKQGIMVMDGLDIHGNVMLENGSS